MSTEVWLSGPVEGIAPIFQPVAHALEQAREAVAKLAPTIPAHLLWSDWGAATAGLRLLHMAGALDRLFTYARSEPLNDSQRAAAKAEAVPHPEMDGAALAAFVGAAIDKALEQLRSTDPATALDDRRVGRAGLPSTVLGC